METNLIKRDPALDVVRAVVAANQKDADDYRNGNEKAINPLFGKCMKELKGNCTPQQLREVLIAEIMG